MALSNCQECGRVFNKVAVGMCPACVDKIEEDFETVYKFLRENGTAHIDTISEETGVEKKWIMKFLNEGRFEGISVSYKCDSCGADITSGKLCGFCANKISNEIQQMQKGAPAPKPQETKAGYHTSLDRYKTK